MSNPSKVSTATEADWSFMQNPDVMVALGAAAHKVAREFELADFDDAYQDAVLWLSVRPDEVAKYDTRKGGMKSLSQNIYANGLRPTAVREAATANRNVVYDPDRGGEV